MKNEKEQKKENGKVFELIVFQLIPLSGVEYLLTPSWKKGVKQIIEKMKSFFS